MLAVLAVLIGVLSVTFAGRAAAERRCDDRTPPFPARVTDVAVDWKVSEFGYDCVYRTYHGGEIRLP